MKYRKKPVVIEAMQWTHFPIEENCLLAEADLKPYGGAECCEHCGNPLYAHALCPTLEGNHIVCPNDFIIKGIKGEFYPCKPDIFEMTYTPADDETEEIKEDRLSELERVVRDYYVNKKGYVVGAGNWGFHISINTIYKWKELKVWFYENDISTKKIEIGFTKEKVDEMFNEAFEYFLDKNREAKHGKEF